MYLKVQRHSPQLLCLCQQTAQALKQEARESPDMFRRIEPVFTHISQHIVVSTSLSNIHKSNYTVTASLYSQSDPGSQNHLIHKASTDVLFIPFTW